MTRKEKKDRLFSNGRPVIRDLVRDDIKWILASYKLEGKDVTVDLYDTIAEELGQYDMVYIIEAVNSKFGEHVGPVAVIACKQNDFISEPHIEFFHWATCRNKLSSVVSFLHKMRYSRLNVVKLRATKETNRLLSKLNHYLPVEFTGRVPNGDELGRGDEYNYHMRCRGV